MRTVAEEVLREFYIHGVSVIEIVREKNRRREDWSACFRRRYKPGRNVDWDYEQRSRFNRRVHTLTDMKLSGPAAGTPYLVTKYSPNGRRTRGTVNNCANGYTPWGTYLTCEENFAGYFRRIAADRQSEAHAEGTHGFRALWRRGHGPRAVGDGDARTRRTTSTAAGTPRSSARPTDGSDDYRNVVNTYGWVVEIDPFDPRLHAEEAHGAGPLRHEGAELGPVKAGEPLVWYMGDDSRNEYIYKFVSKQRLGSARRQWRHGRGRQVPRCGHALRRAVPAGRHGQWIELAFGKNGITAANPAYAFADQADVLMQRAPRRRCRGRHQDGSARVGRGQLAQRRGVFHADQQRRRAAADHGRRRRQSALLQRQEDHRPGQKGNPNGHMIRWAEGGGYADALSFDWDVYLFGARVDARRLTT